MADRRPTVSSPQPAPDDAPADDAPPAEPARALDLFDPRLFINRELSWLEFNQRVLDEAADPGLPAYERLKFLGITASNLDEFFMVRVAGLKRRIEEGVTDPPADGMLPEEQLAAVSARAKAMVAEQYRLWREEIQPALEKEHGIRLVRPRELTDRQRDAAREFFQARVFPVLTPLANDRSHPFPQLRNRSITLAVHLAEPGSRRRRAGPATDLVGVPANLPRLVRVGEGKTFVLLEDLVAERVGDLFPGTPGAQAAAFRITRDWDVEVDEEERRDLLIAIREGVRERDTGEAVRLELSAGAPAEINGPLAAQLGLGDPDVYAVDGPLQLQDMSLLTELTRGDRRQVPRAAPAPRPAAASFEAVARQDLLLHHPYESFQPVLDFIQQAADDPSVRAIKQVLYRIGPESPFVRALLRAAEDGKQVTVFLEIRARFDEDNNMKWVEQLRKAGAVVAYGYEGAPGDVGPCKTHCKVALVVREEEGGMRKYVHLGTGNYNPTTARIYTDVSLLTARKEIADEVVHVFNMLTANTTAGDLSLVPEGKWPWKHLGVAPHGLKRRILDLVAEEARQAQAGAPARILAKMNSLVDPEVIRALYAASRAGVRVDLLVRGICCLRPGVAGVSEGIRVRQVVDRFLEHARIFVFGEGRRARAFISSADWMPRNFHRRVELLVPIEDAAARDRLVEIVEAGLADDVKGSELLPDGRYLRRRPAEGQPGRRSQDLLDPARRRAPEAEPGPAL